MKSFFYDSIQNHNAQLQALFDTDDEWTEEKRDRKKWENMIFYII